MAIALSVTLSVTVLAGADGQRTVTKSQAKKIAKKVVKKKAPKLSVRNAANLDGQAPSLYLDRVAQATSEDVVDVPGTNALEVLGPVNIDVPAGVNHVRVDGGGAFEPDGVFEGTVALWFQLDGPCAKTGFGYENPAYGNTEVGLQQISFHLVTAVTPGSHSFRLCASANNPSTVRARTLLVETVARGPNG
jgi:hypothetical protein